MAIGENLTISEKNDNHSVCRLCGSDIDLIKLRDNSSVCKKCVDNSRDTLLKLMEKKRQIEKDSNIWNKAGFLMVIILIVLALYLWLFSFIYVIIIGIITYNLWIFCESKSEAYKELSSKVINTEKEAIKVKFVPIFDLFWEYPPDWAWRRGQIRERDNGICQRCGRKWLGSSVPFHVHHIIPISNPESSHKFDNLIFLCELCHLKIDEAHSLVKIAREDRLNRNKMHGRQRQKRNRAPSLMERTSVYW